MVHAYRLVSPPPPSAPDPLWEWQQPWIDHLLWHGRTFSRQVELWCFPSGDALDRANTRLWATVYAPRLQYEPWPTWQAWQGIPECENISRLFHPRSHHCMD
jgi:hypothetical protein